MLVSVSFIESAMLAGASEPSEKEKQDCKEELVRIRSWDKALRPGPTNELGKYESFADVIQREWTRRNAQCYARLMLAICSPLSSGRFKDNRQYELAEKYALSALENRDSISLALELDLTGHVSTMLRRPNVRGGRISRNVEEKALRYVFMPGNDWRMQLI